MSDPFHYHDHPLDVLRFLRTQQAAGRSVALACVTDTIGGAVRNIGAIMGISDSGETAGYISNGCVDGDITAQAIEAMRAGTARTLRYGQGSPFMDIRLPCGGGIALTLSPHVNAPVITSAITALEARQAVSFALPLEGHAYITEADQTVSHDAVFTAHFQPKLKVRVAGRGVEALAFARLALTAGFEAELLSPDRDSIVAAQTLGTQSATALRAVQHLTTPDAAPQNHDDPWTAVVLMFHDHDWEAALLQDALKSPAFYIGALGSRRTHEIRCETLRGRGVTEPDIARIHGPIGLVPRLRDASTIAISTLAEVIAAFEAVKTASA